MKLSAGETPIILGRGATMVIHVVPFSTFASSRPIDVVREITNGHVMPLPPGRWGQGNSYSPNLDGFATFSSPSDRAADAYAQVFRSGAIEGVEVLGTDQNMGSPYLAAASFENTVVSAARNYITFVQSLNLGYPVFVFLSFCGMAGCRLRTRTEFGVGHYQSQPLRQDVIALPEAVIERASTDVPSALRTTFNTAWNAFGLMQSDKYNQQGRWIGTA